MVSSFAHQIQSEYYCGNIYLSIEGISMEHLSATTHTETAPEPESHTRHAIFHYFVYDDRKQDSATTY